MDDNNQGQSVPGSNGSDNGQVNAPLNPSPSSLSSFTMDNKLPGTTNEPAVSIPAPEPSSAPVPQDTGKTIEPPDDSTDDDKPADISANNDDDAELLSIKQQAITKLKPMLGHLNQTPEEKFRLTMMMIQANDDKSLIKDAYEAAEQISDEKAKAQALLDVVNEINYFSSNDTGEND